MTGAMGGTMEGMAELFALDYSENELLPWFFIFMAVVIVGVGALVAKGSKNY
jgi:hypothetical protein